MKLGAGETRRVSRVFRASLSAFRRRGGSKAKTASRVDGLKWRRRAGKLSTAQRQSGVTVLLCRHSGCRAGRHNALRIRMPASNPTSRTIGRRTLAAVQRSRAIRARVGTCVSLARHGTPPRAREVLVMESFSGRAWRKQRPAAAAAEKKKLGTGRAFLPAVRKPCSFESRAGMRRETEARLFACRGEAGARRKPVVPVARAGRACARRWKYFLPGRSAR